MIDYVIVSTISSAVHQQTTHTTLDVVLFMLYVVIAIAAVVCAATLRASRKGETSGITLAAVAPSLYLLLLPFGVLAA